MSKVLTVRVDDGLAKWAEGYAAKRGASRRQIHEAALREFRELCATGVPELPEAAQGGRPKETQEPEPRPVSPDVGQVSRVFAERGPIDYRAAAMDRQRKLNEAKYGRSS